MALLSERLVLAEIGDGQAQRIDRQHLVADLVAEGVDDIGSPELAFLFRVVERAGENLVELDPSLERRLPQVLDSDGLDLDIDIGLAGVEQEGLDYFFLFVFLQDRVLQITIQEVECLGEVLVHRVVIAAVVDPRPLGEEVAVLGLLGLVGKVLVVNGFGATDIVDADDERLDAAQSSLRSIEERQGAEGDGSKNKDRQLEVGVGDDRITVLLQVFVSGLGSVEPRLRNGLGFRFWHKRLLQGVHPSTGPPAKNGSRQVRNLEQPVNTDGEGNDKGRQNHVGV